MRTESMTAGRASHPVVKFNDQPPAKLVSEREQRRKLTGQGGNMLSWIYLAVAVLLGVQNASPTSRDETRIRSMVDQALNRLNQGDTTAFDEFWDEDADYVGVTGTLTKGRTQIQALFRQAAGRSGHQTATIEQVRFITPEIATVDGTWTVTGARDPNGQELAPIKGRGFEVVQKKNGRWRFLVTREMVIFGAR